MSGIRRVAAHDDGSYNVQFKHDKQISLGESEVGISTYYTFNKLYDWGSRADRRDFRRDLFSMIRATKRDNFNPSYKNRIRSMGLGVKFKLWLNLIKLGKNSNRGDVESAVSNALQGSKRKDVASSMVSSAQRYGADKLLKKNFRKYNKWSEGHRSELREWARLDIEKFMDGYSERYCGFGGIYGKGTGIKQELDD